MLVNKCFKISLKSFFESIPVQKMVSEVLKTWYRIFFILHFGRLANGGEEKAVFPHSNATGSIKLTRSNLYRLYLIEKNDWRGG